MIKNFIWIISTQLYAGLKKGGISPTYIIPGEIMRDHGRSLVGSDFWLIARGKQDEVVGLIKPSRIERFTDAYYNGDYLLHTNLTSSLRIGSSNADGRPSYVDGFRQLRMGIYEIDAESILRLIDLVRSMIQIKFTQPPAFSIGGLDLEIVPKRRDTLAKIAIYGIIRNYSLDKIWADASPTKLGPFANFAHSLINHRFGASVAAECLVYLREHDPLTALLQPKDRPLASESDRFAIDRMVDLEFAEIDPKSIYAREFVASGHVIDLEAALAKTETSEKLHQDMLRDIAEYLISKGVTPYETRSVDLMTRSAGRMNIFEIKSTNIGNLFAQSSKGSFQLACYCEAMKDDYDHLRPILIIHKTNDNASEKMCINILERLGISCLIYDPSHDWPNRIPNLFCDLE